MIFISLLVALLATPTIAGRAEARPLEATPVEAAEQTIAFLRTGRFRRDADGAEESGRAQP